jgi:hypothetical protein
VLKEEREWVRKIKEAVMTTILSQSCMSEPPRMRTTWAVLEAAKDAGDEMVIAACRRIIAAERIGWRKHGNPADLELVYSFAI